MTKSHPLSNSKFLTKISIMSLINLSQNINIGDPSNGPTYGVNGPLPTLEGPPGVYKFNSLADIVNTVLQILFPLVLIAVFIYLLSAGLDLATSLGNSEKIKKAVAKMTNAVIGLILLAMSYWLAQIVTKVLWS